MPTITKMKPTYKIFVVDDDDFDDLHKDLPYMTKEKLKDSLGFANPKTNEAYVRKTGVAEIDDATMQHELEELLVKVSPDEIDGIRYKKGGFLKNIVPVVLGAINPILGAISGAGMNAYAASRHPEQLGSPVTAGLLGGVGGAVGGSGLKAAFTGARAGVTAATTAGKGFLNRIASGIKGSLLGTPAAVGGSPISVINPSLASATPGFTPASSGLLGSAGGIGGVKNPFLQPGSLTAPSGKLPSTNANILGQSPATTITQAPVVSAPAQAPASPGNLISKAGQFAKDNSTLLGAGLTGASLLPKSPEFKMPDSVEQLRAKILEGQGVSPLGQQAQAELSGILKSSPTELFAPAKDEYYQAVLRRTEDAYSQAQEQLDAAYNQAGVYGSGEHLAAKDKLNQQLTNAKTDLFALTEQRNFELARTQKYQAIQDSLGVDRAVMDDIVGLTSLSVEEAAMVYGAKVEDVKAIREALGTLGVEMMLKGQGVNRNTGSGININVGGGILGG